MASSKSIAVQRSFEADEFQQRAIEHVHGPLLVIAGAGTGKTTVLTRRIARLIHEGHARSDEILALTYTENAAREMRERVQKESGGKLLGLQVETFHAYCNNLLIRNNRSFGVLDDKDLWIYLRKRLPELQLNYFVRAANVTKFLEDLLDFMRRCQDEMVGPKRYADYVGQLERGELPVPRVCKSKEIDNLTDEDVLGRCQEIARVFATIEQMLREENLGTFGHMITKAYSLLREDPQLLAKERGKARFILVDEFQDANFAQVKVLQLLAGTEQNVFAVGDPDQAIYRFRGASSAAFALFQHNFPQAGIEPLQKNRRSTSPILHCAYSLISKNPEVFSGKASSLTYKRAPLISARDEDAAREGREVPRVPVDVVVLSPKGKDIECADVVSMIRERKRELRCKWKDFAVLYRLHSHCEDLAEALAEQGIPYSIDNMDVLDTAEVRDLFACLGAVVSSQDDASLFRVSALPQFGIDPQKLRAGIKSLPRNQETGGVASVLPQIDGGAPVLDALADVRTEILQRKAKSHTAIGIVVDRFRLDRSSPTVAAVFKFVADWEKKPIVKTGELAELLEYVDYLRQAGGTIPIAMPDVDAVQLMTAHTAKGLEFDHVFILRANKPSFPISFKETLVEFPRELRDTDSLALQDDKTLHEQEERRLFYVAMTRAKNQLTIYAKQGTGKTDLTPPGYMRDLVKDKTLAQYLRQRPPRGFQTDIFAQAATPLTRTAEWLGLPPANDLSSRLSASAVQTYKNCPLQFKLDREWRIPGEVPAAMQYGASMHRVLKAYYDSVKVGRTMTDEAILAYFQSDLEQAKIQDAYQHELYLQQGIQQLRAFLVSTRRLMPEVLHTEEWFEVRMGNTTVVGRVDRIDRLPDGHVVITDYKTGKAQDQEDANESLQLSIYALAAREKWGYEARELSFYNLGENTTAITHRNDAQLQDARLEVQEVAECIAAGKFDAKPGFNCRFCAYRNLCPATEKRLFVIQGGKAKAS